MRCERCGAPITEDQLFCQKCGMEIARRAPAPAAPEMTQPGMKRRYAEQKTAQPGMKREYVRQEPPQKKSGRGLLIGLIAGGLAIVAAVVLLLVLHPWSRDGVEKTRRAEATAAVSEPRQEAGNASPAPTPEPTEPKTPEPEPTFAPVQEQPSANPYEDPETIDVTLLIAGTFGDRGMYDSCKAGGDRLARREDINLRYIECNNENHTVRMRDAASQSDILVCVGWEFYDIEFLAPEYPDVRFIWVDNETYESLPNVRSLLFAQNEGSFLAGYIAAAMSRTGVIGAVGGEDNITINDFIVGYEQGAKYFDPAIAVEKNYANSWDDPAKGKDCAKVLHDRGADVIFQVASKAGDGVFDAAAEGGFYAIGNDVDQKYINDAVVICSVTKDYGTAVCAEIQDILTGDWSGGTRIYGVGSGCIGIGYGEEGATQQIPDDIKAQVEALRAKIASGEIRVDTTR